MKNHQLGILLLLAATMIAIPLTLAVPATQATIVRHFDIYQNNSTGGKICSGQLFCFNSTSPGPTITVNQNENVTITVHDNDTSTPSHTFTITSSPYTSVDTGSMSPGQMKTLASFKAGTSGTFHYQCNFHPTSMLGTFKVNPVASAPITPMSLLALLGTTTAAMFIAVKRRR